MKRNTSFVVQSLVVILIGSGILAGSLQAQVDLSMTASIPFSFTVGAQPIPPGTYSIQPRIQSIFSCCARCINGA